MQVSPLYLIRDSGFLLGPTAYDDTSLIYVNDFDGKNLDNNPHINRNHVTVRQVSQIRKRRDSIRVRGASTPSTGSPFGSRLQAPPNRGGGIEQCFTSQSRDGMLSFRPSTQPLLRISLLLLLPSLAML